MVNLLPNQKPEKKEISPYYRAQDCTIDDLPTPGSAQAKDKLDEVPKLFFL
jgi:hypothetical protein